VRRKPSLEMFCANRICGFILLATEREPKIGCRWIWNVHRPQHKENNPYGLLLQTKCSLGKILRSKGAKDQVRVFFAKRLPETMGHLFLHCHFTKEAWNYTQKHCHFTKEVWNYAQGLVFGWDNGVVMT